MNERVVEDQRKDDFARDQLRDREPQAERELVPGPLGELSFPVGVAVLEKLDVEPRIHLDLPLLPACDPAEQQVQALGKLALVRRAELLDRFTQEMPCRRRRLRPLAQEIEFVAMMGDLDLELGEVHRAAGLPRLEFRLGLGEIALGLLERGSETIRLLGDLAADPVLVRHLLRTETPDEITRRFGTIDARLRVAPLFVGASEGRLQGGGILEGTASRGPKDVERGALRIRGLSVERVLLLEALAKPPSASV